MVAACTGVMLVKPKSAIPFNIWGDSFGVIWVQGREEPGGAVGFVALSCDSEGATTLAVGGVVVVLVVETAGVLVEELAVEGLFFTTFADIYTGLA